MNVWVILVNIVSMLVAWGIGAYQGYSVGYAKGRTFNGGEQL